MLSVRHTFYINLFDWRWRNWVIILIPAVAGLLTGLSMMMQSIRNSLTFVKLCISVTFGQRKFRFVIQAGQRTAEWEFRLIIFFTPYTSQHSVGIIKYGQSLLSIFGPVKLAVYLIFLITFSACFSWTPPSPVQWIRLFHFSWTALHRLSGLYLVVAASIIVKRLMVTKTPLLDWTLLQVTWPIWLSKCQANVLAWALCSSSSSSSSNIFVNDSKNRIITIINLSEGKVINWLLN